MATSRKLQVLVLMRSQYAERHSGVATVAFSLLQALLSQSTHDYTLLSPWARQQLPAPLQESRLTVEQCPRPRFMILSILADALRMSRWCKARGFDVVLNVDPFGSPSGGHRRLTIVHDLYFAELAEVYPLRERITSDLTLRLMVARSDALVCVSNTTRNQLIRRYSGTRDKAVTVHSAPPTLQNAREKQQGRIDAPFVLAVGNATPNKNFAALGKAFDLLSEHHPTLRLVHVGKDPARTLTRELSDRARRATISLSNVSDAALTELYRQALALCVPSRAEGFCLPLLEAQRAGCAVACSNCSALPEIAGAGALLFDPEDPQGIASSLRQIISDKSLRERLNHLGQANLARFSWNEAARRYVALIEAGTVRS